ncbi:hypothetical protein [Vulcanisaeta distributa]|uniref:DUF973 family protein n=1 Tax=Vulcanisaeta distributa (strain DSM 14429 / JCM 11212 / NBRC 100878 / IC-017) TaxID=572478 RepID=E1QNN0_VULDI|nr:hypothetical protein [Vulcanisaeta distributa]ADN51318.1 hypothetical protein Vdis_1946 [Vulcanisaeta distributa DSM 14429]
MSIDLLERGIDYIRWSLLIISADAIILTILLLLSLLITPMAAYIFTVVISYFLLISTVIPYVLVVIFWLLGFRDLVHYSRRYFIGFVGSLIITTSYFMNILYMGYLMVNELVGNALIPKPLMLEPLILTYNKYFIVFSLYLPLPLFISLVLGVLGSILSMMTLYRLGNDFNIKRIKIDSLIAIIGILMIETPLIGGLLISIGTALLTLDLGRVFNELGNR